MDIHSKSEYPAGALSNFAQHEFVIDGVKCAGMEGFLQSLKFKDTKKQLEICKLGGKSAKKIGSKKKTWKLTQRLWWQGKTYKRYSDEYQLLLDRAFAELSKNDAFAQALFAVGESEPLTHSIGGHDMRKTVLTEHEFITRLIAIRKRAFECHE